MAVATVSMALTQARTLLNDDNAGTFPDNVLIPKIQIAFLELQSYLAAIVSPIMTNIVSAMAIPANSTSVRTLSVLPSDFDTPFKLFESAQSPTTYTEMTQSTYIYNAPNSTTALVSWAWFGNDILLPGTCTVARTIQMIYRRIYTTPAASGDSLFIPLAEMYLAPRAAALAGGSLGNPSSLAELTGMSKENLDRVLNANRGAQKPVIGKP
jgi:hypothetical protein